MQFPLLRLASRQWERVIWPLLLLGLAIGLFRHHLMGTSVFIGDPDRLNVFLRYLVLYTDGIRQGVLSAWIDTMGTGYNIRSGVEYFPNPLTLLTASFPESALFYVAGVTSLAVLWAVGLSAYYFIKEIVERRFPAFVGAALYQLSALTILKIQQNETTATVFAILPLLLLCIRRTGRDPSAWGFFWLSFLMFLLMQMMFLQTAMYVLLMAGAYTVYRGIVFRSWWTIGQFAAAFLVAFMGAMPRLHALVTELGLAMRTVPGRDLSDFEHLYEFQNIRPYEALRWLSPDIFGGYPSETVRLGNNINLSEGMLINAGALASLAFLYMCCLLLRRSREPIVASKGWDTGFLFTAFALSFLVVVFPPLNSVFYYVFLKAGFTHARILVIGLLPFVAILAIGFDRIMEGGHKEPLSAVSWPRYVVMALAGVVIALVLHGALQAPLPANLAHSILPSGQFGIGHYRFQVPPAVDAVPDRPSAVTVSRTASDRAVLKWSDVAGEDSYRVQLSYDGKKFFDIGRGAGDRTKYEIGSLTPSATYWVRVASCRGGKCSPYSSVHAIGTRRSAESKKQARDLSWARTITLKREALWRIALAALLLTAFVVLLWAFKTGSAGRYAVVVTLCVALISEAFLLADDRFNGAHLKNPEIPFFKNDAMAGIAGEFIRPAEEQRQQLSTRLEKQKYRTIAICDPRVFSNFCAPHLGSFWQMRLVGLYLSGVPKGMAALPWPPKIRGLRTITFPARDAIPWRVLSLLNVKYAVVVTNAFYRNAVIKEGERTPFLVKSLEVISNPLPVTPRAFFAEKVMPVTDEVMAVRRLFATTGVPEVVKVSWVEKYPGPRTFDGAGPIVARFEGDIREFTFPKSPKARFLVVNERFHPYWKAFARGRELPIEKVNAAMSGIEVPAGVTRVTAEFRPFATQWPGYLLRGSALIVLILGCLLLSFGGWVRFLRS